MLSGPTLKFPFKQLVFSEIALFSIFSRKQPIWSEHFRGVWNRTFFGISETILFSIFIQNQAVWSENFSGVWNLTFFWEFQWSKTRLKNGTKGGPPSKELPPPKGLARPPQKSCLKKVLDATRIVFSSFLEIVTFLNFSKVGHFANLPRKQDA